MSEVIPLGPGSRMMTTREAAKRLGVSLRTVQLWVEADILPAAKTPGGHRRIPLTAVEALAISTGLGETQQDKPRAGKRELLAMRQQQLAPTERDVVDVLLVADESGWIDRCEAALAAFGEAVSVRRAETGYLALIQIGQKAPDILITTLALHGMDGMEMLRTLERCESMAHMRIMLLTDLNSEALAAKGGIPERVEQVGAPFTPEDIAARVGRSLLGHPLTKMGYSS
ncbi:MAG: excisionase family DNA-binding protein [Aquabacterium sp.]|uniref:excisionase family DNA-binding protein n=1 Tax=Aquabacterium sp. TaxID=1872578 RepID=UPI003BD6224E